MSILKFKNADGTWNGVAAFKGEDGKDGAIQYKAGYGINISEDNTISTTLDPSAGVTVDTNPTEGSVNPVSSGGVYNALSNKANKTDIPTDLGDFTNGPGYITEEKEEGFHNSTAASITAADISNWNSKQPAGNYITPDYLTTNIISDLVKAHSYNSPFGSSDTGSYTSTPICEEAAALINNIYNSGRKGLISIVYSNGVSDIINNLITVNTTLTAYNLVSPRYNTFIRISGKWNSNVFTCTVVSKYSLFNNYYLAKDNTTAYTPTSDYHPATKLYVDNKVSEGLAGSGFLSEEADPIFTNHIASTITESDITNWNNKADESGITEELDPTVPAWVKSITENDILKWNNKADSSDISGVVEGILSNKGYITEETEPAFNASVAANITQDDIDSWNAKQNALSISDKYNGTSNPIVTEQDITESIKLLGYYSALKSKFFGIKPINNHGINSSRLLHIGVYNGQAAIALGDLFNGIFIGYETYDEFKASNTRTFVSTNNTQIDLIVFAETKIPKTVVAKKAQHHTFNKNKEYYWSVSDSSLMYYLGIDNIFSSSADDPYIVLYSDKGGTRIMTTLGYIEESDCYRVILYADPKFNDARLAGTSIDLFMLTTSNCIQTYNNKSNNNIGELLPILDESGTYLTNLEVVELDWSAVFE